MRPSPIPGPAPRRRAPATLARRLARRAGLIGAWTVGWTLFQWWAVLGWTEGGGVFAGLVFAGVLGLVGRDLGARLDAPGTAPPLEVTSVVLLPPPAVVEDAKAA
jgi:hypothetical protein